MSALPSDRYCGRGQSGRSAVLCVVSLAAAFSAVACSAEDSSRPQEATTTSITTSTTTSTTERTASLSPAHPWLARL